VTDDKHLMIGGVERPCTRCDGYLYKIPNAVNNATGEPEPNKYRCHDCSTEFIIVQVGPAKESSSAGFRKEGVR
jgi:hypothetical protein